MTSEREERGRGGVGNLGPITWANGPMEEAG